MTVFRHFRSLYKKRDGKHFSKNSQFSLYGLTIFLMAILTGFNSLYFVGSSSSLVLLCDLGGLLLDFMLLIAAVKKVERSEIPYLGISIVLGLVCAACSSSIILIKSILLIYAAKDEDYSQLLRSLVIAFLIVILLGLLSSAVGLASVDVFRRNGHALGFRHPNQAALYCSITMILIMVVGIRRKSTIRSNVPALLLVVLLCGCIFLSGSRTALLVPIITLILAACYGFMVHSGCKAIKLIVSILLFSAPILFVFTIVSASLLMESELVQDLDAFLTNRIWLNWFALDHFDITFFGQIVNLHVEGVYNVIRGTGNITTTVDNTYVAGLLSYGMIPIVCWLVATVLAARQSWRSGNGFYFGSSAALSFYAFMESQLMNPLFYFTLLGVLASSSNLNKIEGSNRQLNIGRHYKNTERQING